MCQGQFMGEVMYQGTTSVVPLAASMCRALAAANADPSLRSG